MSFAVAFGQSKIVVSIPPYQDVVQRIAGRDAEVSVLLAPGASPHTFDPTPRDVVRLEQADLIVINGGMDTWTLSMVDALGTHAPVFVALASLSADDLVEGGHEHEHDEHEHDEHEHDEHEHDEHEHDEHDDHDHGHDDHEYEHDEHRHDEDRAATDGDASVSFEDRNPHVWLDPVLMIQVVHRLADALATMNPDDEDGIRSRADALVHDLEHFDRELRETMAPIRGAAFVPLHDAWPYFADRYGLDLVVEIEPFPGQEPTARYLAEALGLIRASGARAIFAEVQLGSRSAEVLADEAGVGLGTLDPLGGVDGRRSYEDLLRYNAEILVETLRNGAHDDH
ncbi:MAG: metal ABC transporter substrate-binding protein [Trueperaceae bacterium]